MYLFRYIYSIPFLLIFIYRSGLARSEFFSRQNRIMDHDGREIQIRGVNYFGFETACNVLHGLWVKNIDFYIDLLSNNDFNSVRIPLSYELMLRLDEMHNQKCLQNDSELLNKTPKEMLHVIFKKFEANGIYVLLDMHTIGGYITEYPQGVDMYHNFHNDLNEGWINIITNFSHYSNFLGVDIKNEPHGNITWAEWEYFVTDFMNTIIQNTGYSGLFFVEGVQYEGSGWGNDFSFIDIETSFLVNHHKVVFSPHVYGVSVRGKIAETETYDTFHNWFGFLMKNTENAVVIGEFGGFFEKSDREWHYKFRDYLISINNTNTFYWCLNPNSGDTKGILYDDWKTLNYDKLAYLKTLWYPDAIHI